MGKYLELQIMSLCVAINLAIKICVSLTEFCRWTCSFSDNRILNNKQNKKYIWLRDKIHLIPAPEVGKEVITKL